MEAQDLQRAVRMMGEVLEPLSAQDWSAAAGTLDWTCRETPAHIGHQLLAYAAQVAGQAKDAYLPLDLVIHDGVPVQDALAAVEACGGLLVAALRAAGPDMRAWHLGPCDVSGFAALGAAEVVLHTHDITQGLKANWRLPARFSTRILDRLAPDATAERRRRTGRREHPTQILLRYTGRLDAAGPWQWRITPLAQNETTGDVPESTGLSPSSAMRTGQDGLHGTGQPSESVPRRRDPVPRVPGGPGDDGLAPSRAAWLDRYVSMRNVIADARDEPYTCPCCGHATLSGRGRFEICDECDWEDDGRDNHDSAVVRGGPNGSLSLDEARIQYVRKGRGRRLKPHFPPSEPV
ncbi:CPCC family cysteine-rich protein [Actinoplanes sp. NPDC020271]|uniref:CPCC family cysteine-rich protein n=1 Tax=Actinoplanes sp. NPDC020271 TaxID=3363896 RepID=UPI003794F0E3